GLDHPLQQRLMAAVAAVTVRVVAADQGRVTLAQLGAVGFRAQAHHAQRLALTRGEADHLLLVAGAASDLRSPSADRVERIVEVGPARHRAGARAEGAGFALPPGDRRLP